MTDKKLEETIIWSSYGISPISSKQFTTIEYQWVKGISLERTEMKGFAADIHNSLKDINPLTKSSNFFSYYKEFKYKNNDESIRRKKPMRKLVIWNSFIHKVKS